MALLCNQTCARCPALAASRRQIVHGAGDATSRVAIVGEAPGRHGADVTGVPFSGDKSGRVLGRTLRELGLSASEDLAQTSGLRCFVTNAVRCCPPGNRTPAPAEVTACAPLLARELDLIDPLVVVAVGRVALREVGLRYLGRDPGPIRALHAAPIQAGGRVIVPMVHPARISRAQLSAFIETMRGVLGRST